MASLSLGMRVIVAGQQGIKFFLDSAAMSRKPEDLVPIRADRLHLILGQLLIPEVLRVSLTLASGRSGLKKQCSFLGPAVSMG